MKVRLIVLSALVVVSAFALTSCSTQARAERKGKEAGDQICKAKNANNAERGAAAHQPSERQARRPGPLHGPRRS